MTAPVVQSVPAGLLHDEIVALGVTHIVNVPDTHQRTLLQAVTEDPRFKLVTLSTEHEAICTNAGLWMGGANPILLIQNVGVFAGMNALRGIAIDMRVPTCMVVGQYGRDVNLPIDERQNSATRLIAPVMQTLGVPCYSIDGPEDVHFLREAFIESREKRCPTVVLLGAPTA
jgi:sulfopyruvate decarboxylase TPP-binding subunit